MVEEEVKGFRNPDPSPNQPQPTPNPNPEGTIYAISFFLKPATPGFNKKGNATNKASGSTRAWQQNSPTPVPGRLTSTPPVSLAPDQVFRRSVVYEHRLRLYFLPIPARLPRGRQPRNFGQTRNVSWTPPSRLSGLVSRQPPGFSDQRSRGFDARHLRPRQALAAAVPSTPPLAVPLSSPLPGPTIP